MSCRTCRDPATKRGEFPRLEEKAQSQSAGLELLLKVRTEHSGLNARGLRSVADFQNLVEVFHVDRESTAITIVLGGGLLLRRRSSRRRTVWLPGYRVRTSG